MPAEYDPRRHHLPAPPARVHFVGIGGVGVSGLARMLAARGYAVSGSDRESSRLTEELESEGINVSIGHAPEHVAGASLVVATAAAASTNPELVAAQNRRIPVIKRAEMLGLLANERACLAVAGTHGKSTTSGMATLALHRAGLDPSFAVGATVRELGTNARAGRGPHFVAEADEYDRSFLWLRPQVAIVTNIEHDHPDVFPDLDAVLDAFERFVRGIRLGGTLVIAADDRGCQALLERMGGAGEPRVVTFGEVRGDWRVSPDGHVTSAYGQVFDLRLSVPGRHNLRNALAVLAAAEGLGVAPDSLVEGLSAFGGVSRRFDVLVDTVALTVVSDYAHHPTEVVATLAAARERYPGRRLLVIFQPHTYSRTRLLLDDFATALDGADEVILAEIYASRETDTLGVTSRHIAERMQQSAALVSTPEHAAGVARQMMNDGDVVIVMGAGDIVAAAEALAGAGR